MATGWHAAVSAGVRPGSTVVVVGDGAVGLCGVSPRPSSARDRIIAMSRHAAGRRWPEFGATHIIAERGDGGLAQVLELTDGIGADAVLECVGTEEPVCRRSARRGPAAWSAWSACPHVTCTPTSMFWRNSGSAAARHRYAPTCRPARPRARRPDRPREGLRPHPPTSEVRRGLPRPWTSGAPSRCSWSPERHASTTFPATPVPLSACGLAVDSRRIPTQPTNLTTLDHRRHEALSWR